MNLSPKIVDALQLKPTNQPAKVAPKKNPLKSFLGWIAGLFKRLFKLDRGGEFDPTSKVIERFYEEHPPQTKSAKLAKQELLQLSKQADKVFTDLGLHDEKIPVHERMQKLENHYNAQPGHQPVKYPQFVEGVDGSKDDVKRLYAKFFLKQELLQFQANKGPDTESLFQKYFGVGQAELEKKLMEAIKAEDAKTPDESKIKDEGLISREMERCKVVERIEQAKTEKLHMKTEIDQILGTASGERSSIPTEPLPINSIGGDSKGAGVSGLKMSTIEVS